ncbi:hypothetical protein [Solwaraspora sp. WMMD792]|uniref:hypothetical protein n=1 Tax=Solwaraspora sp. WMMD792 TaxID=3016099 RepID=UPI002417C1DB|nr:hypothetical protein [Solwaraspora sp. WMMD792]MDG4774042.1 hypothetical protein [Solwaraspora sp. WMMD792]
MASIRFFAVGSSQTARIQLACPRKLGRGFQVCSGVPMCLSHHPRSPLTTEEVVQRAAVHR